MPRKPMKFKPKKRYLRKFKRKLYRKRGNLMTLRNSNPGQLIAPRYITKLKYASTGTFIASTMGLAGATQFNLNSIYDPDRTGVGHQPLGRDQLALLYSRYRVFGCSWTVVFYPISATTSGTVFVLPFNESNLFGGTTFDALVEQPRCAHKILSTTDPTVFKGRISLPKLCGQTSAQYKAGDRYMAQFGSDPSELMALNLCGISQIANNITFRYEISLTYNVECFDPVQLSQS